MNILSRNLTREFSTCEVEEKLSHGLHRPLPEVDEHGQIIWRAAWKNELMKLETLTAEQDKLCAEPEWYREMLFRVRTAMMAPIDQNGVLQMATATSVYTQPQPHSDGSGQPPMNNHHQGHHEEEHE